jgi:hypothetical protein
MELGALADRFSGRENENLGVGAGIGNHDSRTPISASGTIRSIAGHAAVFAENPGFQTSSS